MELPNEKVAEISSRKYDIVVFGASGFTGQFVVEEVARTIAEERLKWAVAGRHMRKLQAVLATASKETGKDLSELPIIIADVNDEASLLDMCSQAQVVINCVGPYAFFGTAVVKACIEAGSCHIDISGEPGWLENTQLVFNGKAQDSGVYVLQACGFDSIPAEMGLLYTRKQFEGDLNGVEAFVATPFGSEGGSGHYGTWLSAVHGLHRMRELKDIRRQLFPSPLPRSQHPIPKRFPLFFGSDVNSWCFPLLSADKSIVYRSEYFNWIHKKQKPVQFKVFYCVPGLLRLFFMVLLGMIFFVLSQFQFGVSLLEKYPRLFSMGMFSHEGPTRKQIAGSSFSITFACNGYPSKKTNDDALRQDLPKKRIVTRVSGPEAGYIATPICTVQAAYVLLKERDKLPNRGGVLTPGAAFAETSLIDRLERHGVHFATIEN